MFLWFLLGDTEIRLIYMDLAGSVNSCLYFPVQNEEKASIWVMLNIAECCTKL